MYGLALRALKERMCGITLRGHTFFERRRNFCILSVTHVKLFAVYFRMSWKICLGFESLLDRMW